MHQESANIDMVNCTSFKPESKILYNGICTKMTLKIATYNAWNVKYLIYLKSLATPVANSKVQIYRVFPETTGNPLPTWLVYLSYDWQREQILILVIAICIHQQFGFRQGYPAFTNNT